jgi:hypothetical protein
MSIRIWDSKGSALETDSLSRSNPKRKEILAEVTRPISGKDLKPDLVRSRWKRSLPLEKTRLARIIQTEFI